MRVALPYGILLFLFFSCTRRDSQPGAAAPFATYTFTGDEESEMVTGVFRFYPAAEDAEAIALVAPAQILFDGAPVVGDSAGLSGTYYEVQKPLAAFSGQHTILFKDAAGKKHVDTFTFRPLTLAEEPPEPVTSKALTLRLAGMADGETVRVLLTDTSFASPDINEELAVRGGSVTLSPALLQNVIAGPMVLQLFQEVARPLKNAPGGGELSITYSVSRTFTLAE